jgi:hypothetical protein
MELQAVVCFFFGFISHVCHRNVSYDHKNFISVLRDCCFHLPNVPIHDYFCYRRISPFTSHKSFVPTTSHRSHPPSSSSITHSRSFTSFLSLQYFWITYIGIGYWIAEPHRYYQDSSVITSPISYFILPILIFLEFFVFAKINRIIIRR